MRLKKKIAVALCAAMLITLLAGCGEPGGWYMDSNGGQTTGEPTPADTSSSPSLSPSPTTSALTGNSDFYMLEDIDFDAAFNAFPPDTVMIKADDYTITWEELFFHLRGALNYIYSMFGALPNLSGTFSDGATYADNIMAYAIDNALLYRGLEHGAKINGIELDENDLVLINIDFDNIVAIYGGEDSLLQILWESDGIKRLELFHYLYTIGYLSNAAFNRIYGEGGSFMTDVEVAELTVDDGFLMAKHILRLKTEEDSETPLSASEDILNMLNAYNGDDFSGYFDELMHEHSEDGGLERFPDGYLFQNGDMMQEFYDACIALDIGGHSGIVETTYGYHIIHRISINYDSVPSSYAINNDMRSLREIIAMSLFDEELYDWIDLLTVEYTAAFDAIDIPLLFGI